MKIILIVKTIIVKIWEVNIRLCNVLTLYLCTVHGATIKIIMWVGFNMWGCFL